MCFSDTAMLWWNAVQANHEVPATLNALRDIFYAKFRVCKTRQKLKRELKDCKYIQGVSCLPMINKFQQICGKLELPILFLFSFFYQIL